MSRYYIRQLVIDRDFNILRVKRWTESDGFQAHGAAAGWQSQPPSAAL
jgi:hypothetical protein